MSQFQQRSPAKDNVSGRKGYINGVCTQEGVETSYQLLHVDGDGDRAYTWVPESQIKLLDPSELPPFDYPYPTSIVESSPGRPG